MRWRWLLLALGLLVAGFAWLALTPAPAVRQGPLVVTIPPHDGLLGIADRLAQAQVIRSRPAFVVATLVRGTPRSLKAGEYEIPRDATIVDIVALLESGRARERGLSAHQLLTLASIIEREAIVKDEQRLISAVFWNRLKIGMPLQADPTVQYAAAKERRALSRADLVIDHPHNTYVHAGLPPGPIARPGLEAIHPPPDPPPVKDLYFVARDDHPHHLSTTVDEHNAP